jgi:deazaflavin-dependent oxidoreductase (nitroreductase family)
MTGAGGERDSRTRSVVQKISSTRAFAVVAPHVVPLLDKAVHRLTGGKVLMSARMLPGVILTTTGARSGEPRQSPLACMPEDGGTSHPAWTGNLLKQPEARMDWRGREIPVTATLLAGEERARTWDAVVRFWPPYASYAARVEREIRLFRLTPRK